MNEEKQTNEDQRGYGRSWMRRVVGLIFKRNKKERLQEKLSGIEAEADLLMSFVDGARRSSDGCPSFYVDKLLKLTNEKARLRKRISFLA